MKGQSSLDALVMMGFGLVLAAAFFYVANTMISDSIASSQAHDAVVKISNEISYAHSSGKGTVRYADIMIPNGIEEINVGESRIHMRVRLSGGSSDYFSNTDARLVGSIPVEPGAERVVVRYLDSGNIQVGSLQLSASPKKMEFYLAQPENSSREIVISNNADFTITGINATLSGLPGMAIITNPASSLAVGENDAIDISVSVPADKPSGTYKGYVRLDSTNGGHDDVHIIVTVSKGAPSSCSLSPASVNLPLGQPQPFTADCRNTKDEPVSCPLLTWSTDAGAVIPAVSYSSATLVPTSTAGTYIRAESGFSCDAAVEVTGGPLVTALSISPASPFELDAIIVNATGDDTGRGNAILSLCQLKVDSGAWQDMDAVDGSYDSVSEDVSKAIGMLAKGLHSVSVRCNNSEGDWGPQRTHAFTVTPEGPEITALFSTPAFPANTDQVTIHATADDSARRGDMISLCQVSVDAGAYQDMDADDGSYDSSVEAVSLNIGMLSPGMHNATVRCNDSAGNWGDESAIEFFVNAGPLVTALFTTPASITAGTLITINATASDIGRGDEGISLCQVSVDAGAYQDMDADDGSYDSAIENVSLSIGPKPPGQHNATVRCNDSAGNWGPESTINFTVSAKPILFITDTAAPDYFEQIWLTWISGQSSDLGQDWAYTVARDSDVVNGAINISDFKITMMARYDTALSGLNTTLRNYQNKGGVLLLTGYSIEYGPQRLGYTASQGLVDGENEIYIVDNSHYITSGFATGRLTVLGINANNYRSRDSLGGNILADGMRANSRQAGEPVLDIADGLITWGPVKPDVFNENANVLTRRIIDYALNASAIGG